MKFSFLADQIFVVVNFIVRVAIVAGEIDDGYSYILLLLLTKKGRPFNNIIDVISGQFPTLRCFVLG